MKACFLQYVFQCLLMGSPGDFFGSSCSLRHGDLLSPLLFYCVGDGGAK